MKIIPLIALTALALGAPADAAGCLKGAAAGGVAGHFVGKGHAVAGAAAGCVINHHRHAVAQRKAATQTHR